ncbi:MAG TPA: OmpH family outer membrane protein, partial [Verrucomicrobiota bacterium]|nr:OmpH family outer membrane protein [Verrucomicrobiota bacterium]
MKKPALKIIPVFLTLFLLGAATSWAQTRVATVDLRKLFDKYYKTELAQKALKERGNDLAAEGTAMREEAKKINDDYRKLLAEANDQALSTEIREKRKAEAETKLRELRTTEENLVQFERQARITLEDQNRRMRNNIIDEIRTVVNGRAKSAGYSLVIDISADSMNATPVVLFASPENDITEAVLAQINAAAPL